MRLGDVPIGWLITRPSLSTVVAQDHGGRTCVRRLDESGGPSTQTFLIHSDTEVTACAPEDARVPTGAEPTQLPGGGS